MENDPHGRQPQWTINEIAGYGWIWVKVALWQLYKFLSLSPIINVVCFSWQGYWLEQIPIREAEDGVKYFLKTNKLETWIIQSISYLKGAMMKWFMTY